jgi:hypothetical protein
MSGSVSPKARSRAIAHRFGAVCAMGAEEQAVLGIRYDEEDEAAAESFLVLLSPGRADIVDQIPGVAVAVAASSAGKVFVLDARGVVHVDGRKHRLAGPRTLVPFLGGVALAAADQIWLLDGQGEGVTPGPQLRARRLAACGPALLCATDDGRLIHAEGGVEREVEVRGGGQMAALALDEEGRIAAASGRTLLLGDKGGIAPVAAAPFEIHSVALHTRARGRRLFFSSRAHGLFALEEEEGNRVVPVKPSLRAHTLTVKDGVLVAASDLFVATSDDGVEFLTRDLAPFVRLADKRLPRFAGNDDTGAA